MKDITLLMKKVLTGKYIHGVPPIFSNGIFIPQGNFSPIIRVVTPKSKTIISTEMFSRITKRMDVNVNFTLENYDRNLFSDLDDKDNHSASTIYRIKIQSVGY